MPEYPIRIENWSISNQDDNPHQSPDLKKDCLRGRVYGHPECSDGEYIITPVVINTEGCYAKTRNDIYLLGEIDPKYLEWLNENGMEYDPSEPIRL